MVTILSKNCMPSLLFMHKFASELVNSRDTFPSCNRLLEAFVTCRMRMENYVDKSFVLYLFSYLVQHSCDVFDVVKKFLPGISFHLHCVECICKNIVLASFLTSNLFRRISHTSCGSSFLAIYFNKLSFNANL